MEENLHKDKLGDFVRSSLNDHEELPPSDMWERVESAMAEEGQKPAFWFWTPRIQRIAAALLVFALVTTVVAEYWYYEGKLKSLQTGNVEAPNKTEEQPVRIKTPANGTETEIENKGVNKSENKSESPEEVHSQEIVNSKAVPTHAIPQQENAPIKKEPKEIMTAEDRKPATEKAAASSAGTGHVSEMPVTGPENASLLVQPLIALENLPSSPQAIPSAPGKQPVFAPVKAAVAAKPMIEPVKNSSGWYLGLQGGTAFHVGKAKTPISRPGRPAFANQQQSAQNTLVWLRAGKRMNGFLFESGIGYQNMRREVSISPRFRFGEGLQIGSPMDRRRLYQCELNTYGGTAEVDLSMERSSSAPQPSDDEPVKLKINVKERLEWLRVPLLIGGYLERNQWQGSIKAGVVANFMLKNEVGITSSVSQSALFQPVTNALRFKPKSFVWGYYMATNVGYRLNRNFSLSLEHALMVDLPGKDQYRRSLPKHYLMGLNLGATYYF